MILSDLAKY